MPHIKQNKNKEIPCDDINRYENIFSKIQKEGEEKYSPGGDINFNIIR